MQKTFSIIKPYLRWIIFGATLFFIIQTFIHHWQKIAEVRINSKGWEILFIALMVTILAHLWSGWVWIWILRSFKLPIKNSWALSIYLTTNLAKYFPGNIGHFYGRIAAISKQGGSLSIASFSVLLEPLLMAAAALILALLSQAVGFIKTTSESYILGFQVLCLVIILAGIHPFFLNKLLLLVRKLKQKSQPIEAVYIDHYPGRALLGEIGFILLRGSGFILTWMALIPVEISQIPVLLSAFSFAWLLGLIIPGAPGGIGVFEATIIALLDRSTFPSGVLLSSIAIFRVISILAEFIGAALGKWLLQQR